METYYCKTLTGLTIAVDLARDYTILDLKERLHDKQGWEITCMTIYVGNKAIGDDVTIEQANPKASQYFYVTIRSAAARQPEAAKEVSPQEEKGPV